MLTVDSSDYYLKALSLFKNNSFELFKGYRTPLYPLFVSGIFKIFSTNIAILFIFQIGLDLINVYLVYLLAFNISLNKKISILAALLYSISMINIVYLFHVLTDTLFTTLFNFFMLLLFKFYKNHNYKIICYLSILLGIATLVRPITTYFPFVIIGAIFLINISLKRKIKYGLLFIIMFFVTISPWQLYNLSEHEKYELSTMQSHQIKIYSNKILQYKNLNENHGINNKESNLILNKDAHLTYIISNFDIFILLTLKGVVNTFFGTAKTEILKIFGFKINNPGEETLKMRIKRVILNLSKEFYLSPILLLKQFIEYILGIIGMYYFYTKRKFLELFTIIITILYFSFLPSMYGDPRYRIPIVSIYLICTSAGVMSIYNYYINIIKLKIK